MPFDGFVMSAVAAELNEKIILGRIDKIHQPDKNIIVLRIRKERENYKLLISAHAVTNRIHFTNETKENPTHPPLFCMVLRKHLEGGRITRITQDGLERVLNIHVESIDELGRLSEKILVIEIMGKHSNIILVKPENNEILDGIHRYTHMVSRHREVLPGRPYIAAPAQDKSNPLGINEEGFRKVMLSGSLLTKVSNTIVKSFSGFSPLLAREVVARAQLSEDIIIDNLGDYEFIQLWQAFNEVIETVKNTNFQPTVARSDDRILDFSCINLLQFPSDYTEPFSTISETLDYFYTLQENQEVFGNRRRELLKLVQGEMDRVAKKLSLQYEKLSETIDADKYKIYGELIIANMYQLKKGMEYAELENYYDSGTKLHIELNPQLSPTENSQFYFKKYNKAKSSKIFVEEQIAKGREELSYLESVASSLEQAITLDDLAEIRSELVDAGYLKDKPLKKGKKIKKIESEPLSFMSQDGYTILVGKNNKQNDRLTLKIAHKDDIWLHTKDIPGSHVIIRKKDGSEIPYSTIEEAAKLAAYHSKARHSSQVPVDYTVVKQVKKPSGAKPGMVIYFEQRTIYVTPE